MMWIKEWKQDVKAMELEVRNLKTRLRRDWSLYSQEVVEVVNVFRGVEYRRKELKEAPGFDQSKLAGLKIQLTRMYAYRAMNRNKNHAYYNMAEPKDVHVLKTNMVKYEKIKEEELELRKVAQTILDLAALAETNLA